MKNLLTYFIVLIALNFSCSSQQSVTIKEVSSFSKIPTRVDGNKETIKKRYNSGDFIPDISIDAAKVKQVVDTLVILKNEKAYASYYIENNSNESLSLTLKKLPLNTTVYRVLAISDWYSEGNARTSFMEFYPDALFKINPTLLDKGLIIKANERLQLLIELKDLDHGFQKIQIPFIINKKEKITEHIHVKVLKHPLPSTDYNSIIFNQINLQSGSGVLGTWKDAGFTHLQVNYIPTVIFDKNGIPITNKIDHKTSTSTGFRNTAYPWIRENGSILLFWQPRYGKLAKTQSGEFLKPFSNEWLNAFQHLISIIYKDLNTKYPGTQKDQIFIYLADEVSRFRESEKNKGYRKLADFIETKMPEFKTLLTYGHYTDQAMVDSFDGIDIHVPHVRMPKERIKNKIKVDPRTVYKSLKLKQSEKWMYSIESGKKADLFKFYLLPAIAASQGYKGFSWYSFADHAGSTWDATDGKRLDYSLYYHKEVKNDIYNYWSDRLETKDYLTSSLRLKSLEKGLIDARLISWLQENKASFVLNDQHEIEALLSVYQNINIETDSEQKLTESHLEKASSSSRNLRLLYARLINDYKL